MQYPPEVFFLVIPNTGCAGIVAAIFMKRLPMSGKAALTSLLIPLLAFIASGGGPAPKVLGEEYASHEIALWVTAGSVLAITAPCCLLYAWNSMRQARDRLFGLAAFAGSMLMAFAWFSTLSSFTSAALERLLAD
jgi:hypothetical protein